MLQSHYRSVRNSLPSIISGTSLTNTLGFDYASVVEHDNSFVIIGGNNNSTGPSDKILKYEAAWQNWTEIPSTLSEAKYQITAMKVKSTAFDSCTGTHAY